MSDQDLQGLVQRARQEAHDYVFPAGRTPQLLRQCADAIERLSAEKFNTDTVLEAERFRSAALRDSIDGCAKRVAELVAKRGTCNSCRFERPGELSQFCTCQTSLAHQMRTTDRRSTFTCSEYEPQPTATEEAEK